MSSHDHTAAVRGDPPDDPDPDATRSMLALCASQSAHRSALVSTTTGEAPLSHAVAR